MTYKDTEGDIDEPEEESYRCADCNRPVYWAAWLNDGNGGWEVYAPAEITTPHRHWVSG